MMTVRGWAVLLLALALPVPLAVAQGLGDAATRERAKRQKQQTKAGDTGRSYSNTDLERDKPADDAQQKATGPAASAPPAAVSSSEPPDSADPSPPVPPSQPEAPPVSRVSELEASIKALQDKLNPMSGSYIFGPFGSNDPTEEPRLREELQRLQAELVQAREEAANAAAAPQRQGESGPE